MSSKYVVAHCVDGEGVMHFDLMTAEDEIQAVTKVLGYDELPDGVTTLNDLYEHAFDGGIVIGAMRISSSDDGED